MDCFMDSKADRLIRCYHHHAVLPDFVFRKPCDIIIY
ncbi:BgTH12-01712 [Blumeria graminis f. sp. triticale]|uniref:Bgt-50337 n=3 Tax=Blumeria graminis TaxID=34373 RepID=A0A9X9MEZ1_BLUGR|nr:BgTH12-01712 [Blumeria graminis f. sp. triticale]VDB83960.1 Bgt-50337 [Blumeria graminis f. sp. tritici]